MLIDELDSMLRGDMGEALRGILNTGFYRTGKYTVCVTGEDGNYQVKKFSTFCPKVLAGIGKLWDTVASRSIPIKLKRADEKEAKGLKKIRGDRIAGECRPFASRLLRFVTDIKDQLAEADPGVPEELGARQADIWRPLFAIADLAGGHWPETARAAAVAIHRTPDDEGDFGLVILADLRDLFVRDGGDALFSEWIVEQLAKEEGRPWSEYRNDKPITKRQLANLLKRFDVTPMTVRRGAETQKGYRLEDLAGAFATYLPEPDPVDDSEEV
jgi:hypothetical protein